MRPLETGGVLLGFVDVDDKEQLQVVASVGPGPRAVHRRDRFEPDTAWQLERIAKAYRDSGNVVRYLGDWHSHPGASTQPSRLDRRTATRIARHRQARVRHPLIAILGGGELDAWVLACWRYQRRRLLEVEHRLAG